MIQRSTVPFAVAAGEDGNDHIGRVVTGVEAVTLATPADYPRGVVAYADENNVGVVRDGVVEAYFGAAYDPATDSALLTQDDNGRLIEATDGTWVIAEYYDGGAVTAPEAAAGTAVRRVIVRPPVLLPEA